MVWLINRHTWLLMTSRRAISECSIRFTYGSHLRISNYLCKIKNNINLVQWIICSVIIYNEESGTIEFFLNIVIEFIEFSDKNICPYCSTLPPPVFKIRMLLQCQQDTWGDRILILTPIQTSDSLNSLNSVNSCSI